MASVYTMVLHCVSAILLCAAIFAPAGNALPPPFSVTTTLPNDKNLKGDLIVLDYASLSQNLVIDSVDKCEKACKSVAGCNAFLYCDRDAGCGNSCGAYVAGKPKLGYADDDYKSLGLPIDRIGYWAPGNGCNGAAWRKGICSLKKVANTSAPEYWGTELGWKAGVIDLYNPWVGKCGGKPFGFCDMCGFAYWNVFGNTSNYDQCMTCGDNAQKSSGSGTLVPSNLDQATKAWNCQYCNTLTLSNTAYDRAPCFNCVPKHTGKGIPFLCNF